MNPPPDVPESKISKRRPPREREESFKRWLAVLISLVALLVGVTTFLQADASAQNARYNRLTQQNAVSASTAAMRGQQQYVFSEFVVAREYDELRMQAQRLQASGEVRAASAYITASEVLTRLTPLLGPDYASPRASDGWRIPSYARYEADTWVVTSTLLSQLREVALAEANGWDGKASNYIVAITLFAVVLFLLGLSSTVSGMVRGVLMLVGVALTVAALAWVVTTFASPIPHIPERAVTAYARGAGLMWQYKYEEAAGAFDEAIRLAPDYAGAYAERGSAYMSYKPPKLTEAIRDYQMAIEKGMDRYEVHWSLGWAYFLAGDYEQSIIHSQKSLALNQAACGPAFNIAIAKLALGNAAETDKAYESAMAHCAGIALAPPEKGFGSPTSVWVIVQASIADIENLLCQTHKRYCYPNRDQPDVQRVRDHAGVLTLGEKYRRRVKEALVLMEYYPSSKVIALTGAKIEPLRFGNEAIDEDGQYRSYVERVRFPDDRKAINALFNYKGLDKTVQTVWKVFRDGNDEVGLRYDGLWNLEKDGAAFKPITQRYGLLPGSYEVEFYGNGELLAEGSFEVAEEEVLTVPLPTNARPSAAVNVGNLLFADDFADNARGWWTGQIERTREGVVAGGEYRVVTRLPDDYWRVTCDACRDAENVYYEANTRYVAGPTDWGYGLILHSDFSTRRAYLFLINANGMYSIWRAAEGTPTKLADWTTHNAVRPKGQNRIGVAARGGVLEFFVNGQSVRRVNDTTLGKGYFGVTVERTDLEVAFSQARLWQLR